MSGKDWNVNCQAVGTGEHSLKYLAPYVFKVAISNSRIVKVRRSKVFFKYKKNRSNRWRTMTLDVMEFIRRFLAARFAHRLYEGSLLRIFTPGIFCPAG